MNAIFRLLNTFPNRIVFACAVTASLAIYLLTTSLTVAFMDAGEFALRAHQLGATHSPGAPLFVLLAHAVGWVVPNPALAANLISIISASITAGLAGILLYTQTQKIIISITGALAFSLIFTIWGNAVISEAYALSLLFIVASVLSVFLWRETEQSSFPWQIAILYGLALAAHFANILLLPAYLLLFLYGGNNSWADCIKFLAATFIFILSIGACNYLLAMNEPAYGSVSPDSLSNLYLYMTGSQHEPLANRGWGFFSGRLSDHFWMFSRYYWFVFVPVGLIGAMRLFLGQRVTGLFLILIFSIYMGYFTLFGAGDYFQMVGPAYFVFSIWVVIGIQYLGRCVEGRWLERMLLGLLMAAVVLSFSGQIRSRYTQARAGFAEHYVTQAFAIIPAGSIVIARWNEFTALNYMQVVGQLRPDLKVIVPANDKRDYDFGEVDGYLTYVEDGICNTPVVTNKLTDELIDQYEYLPIGEDNWWYQLRPKGQCNAEQSE
jgi:hypothetical protein